MLLCSYLTLQLYNLPVMTSFFTITLICCRNSFVSHYFVSNHNHNHFSEFDAYNAENNGIVRHILAMICFEKVLSQILSSCRLSRFNS